MNINILFTLIGGVALAGAIGLFIADNKYDKSLADKPGLRSSMHLGTIVFLSIGVAFMILSGSIRNCPNCKNIMDSNYCDECGHQVRAMKYPQKSFCLECGADINTDANFCGYCGSEVKE